MLADLAPRKSYKRPSCLIDDQPMIGEAVRRMLAGEADIEFHYCKDPTQAIEKAARSSPRSSSRTS